MSKKSVKDKESIFKLEKVIKNTVKACMNEYFVYCAWD